MEKMVELNAALKLAVQQSGGDSQLFAYLLTAPLAGWIVHGKLDKETTMQAIDLLHELHPDVDV